MSTYQEIGRGAGNETAEEGFGSIVSMSTDGATFLVDTPLKDGNDMFTRQIRLYHFNASIDDYQQVGAVIQGDPAGDAFGYAYGDAFVSSMRLSADGTTFVVGAPYGSGISGDPPGGVRVYYFNSTSNDYSQIGSEIRGTSIDRRLGSSVGISGDGTIIVVGAKYIRRSGTQQIGLFRVYQFNITTKDYEQVGSDITGKNVIDAFSKPISMSADGKTFVVTAGDNLVRVYSFQPAIGSYLQIGMDINGEAGNDIFGNSVSMSADGSLFVVGAQLNGGRGTFSGHVRVYHFNPTINRYEQFGPDIYGDAEYDYLGSSVSISADGTTIAAAGKGVKFVNGSYSLNNHVRIYSIDEATDSYAKVVDDIKAREAEIWLVSSVSMSGNGTILVVGVPFKSGRARVYRKTNSTASPTRIPTRTPTKIPTRAPTNVPLPITSLNRCGLFGLNLLCPRRGKCGFFRRLFRIGQCE